MHTHMRSPIFNRPSVAAGGMALGAATAAAGLAILYKTDPTSGSSILPKCPFLALTGHWCPGCGATRSLYSLLHGDLASTFTYNSLFAIALPLLLWFGISNAYAFYKGRGQRPLLELSPTGAWVLVGSVILFGVLRNVPVSPFTFLAPHAA